MTATPSLRTRARVINQLGEQLIKNESIALLELIKNSYDADASTCLVRMTNPDDIVNGIIEITDDGEGMDYQTITTAWLEIGTSHKDDLRSSAKTRRSKKHKRLRLGEKGIGRLGVHRLGKKVEIVTKKNRSAECVLVLDWNAINESKYIEDLPVEVYERDPVVFGKNTGTRITISELRIPWTRGMARDCSRSILSLNSPFESNDSFQVDFSIPGYNWLDDLIQYDDIEEYRLFDFDVTMEGKEITKFSYQFLPWQTMKKLKVRKVTEKDPAFIPLTRMQYRFERQEQEIDLKKHRIGQVRFKGHIFDRDTKILSLGVQDKLGLKRYLNSNGGVRVYRDNMRVLDYGEPGNDWLDLGGRRVNMPAKRISNNILVGAVYLDRKTSDDLTEKANREGFVENDAYRNLWASIRFAMDRIESLRQTDKSLLRKHYGGSKTSLPVTSSIEDVKEVVKNKVKNIETRDEINRYLDRITTEYESITESLMRSAGAGLNLIVVIHQIEKIIKDILSMLRRKVTPKNMEDRVKGLASLVEGYSILVKKSEKKERNLKGVAEQCVANMEFRLEDHAIKLNAPYRSRTKSMDAICSVDHVLNALMNLFDNSIWWLGYGQVKSPEIFVDISAEVPGHVSIVVADNGPGFTKPTDEIIKPFVSDKPNGMGIGLHLTHQIMESLGGQLIFPGIDIFDIPSKFRRGAIVALAFKKG